MKLAHKFICCRFDDNILFENVIKHQSIKKCSSLKRNGKCFYDNKKCKIVTYIKDEN